MLDFNMLADVISDGFWKIMRVPLRFIDGLPSFVKYIFTGLFIIFGIFVMYHVNKNKDEIWRIRT